MTEKHCPDCRTETLFDTPPCEDGHAGDCVDLACVECGFALTTVHGLVVADDEVLAA